VHHLDKIGFTEEVFEPATSESVPDVDNLRLINREKVQGVETMPTFRQVLEAKGIYDRGGLMSTGIKNFEMMDFSPYGKGRCFCNAVMGWKKSQVSNDILRAVADKLELPLVVGERLELFKDTLKMHGVTDRESLLAFGPTAFEKYQKEFPPFGKGRAFLGAVLAETVPYATDKVLHEVADALGFPKTPMSYYRNILANYRICDRATLMRLGARGFYYKEFCPVGKGSAFGHAVLGRVLSHVSSGDLLEIADKLDLPLVSVNSLHKFKDILFRHKIYDRKTLRNMNREDLDRLEFPPYGKIRAFAAAVLDESNLMLSRGLLENMADRLKLPEDAGGVEPNIRYFDLYCDSFAVGFKTRQEIVSAALDLFYDFEINVKSDFFKKGTAWFMKKKFKRFGTGPDMVSLVLGRRVENITEADLGELADLLGYRDYKDLDEEE